jgi:hypothetical protein
MDIDWIEFRNGNPVALLEISKTLPKYLDMVCNGEIDDAYRYTLFFVPRRLSLQLSTIQAYCRKMHVKGYVVIYDDELHGFLVLDVMQATSNLKFDEYPDGVESLDCQMMDRDKYRSFLESL